MDFLVKLVPEHARKQCAFVGWWYVTGKDGLKISWGPNWCLLETSGDRHCLLSYKIGNAWIFFVRDYYPPHPRKGKKRLLMQQNRLRFCKVLEEWWSMPPESMYQFALNSVCLICTSTMQGCTLCMPMFGPTFVCGSRLFIDLYLPRSLLYQWPPMWFVGNT